MSDPQLRREGNLRLAALASAGLPADPNDLREKVEALLRQDVNAKTYGPTTVMVDLPPDEDDPEQWSCQVGVPIIGQPKAQGDLLIEDYRQLNAWHRPYMGPMRRLRSAVAELRDQARAMGWQVRPYWRLSIRMDHCSDGHLLPDAELAIFTDR